jgi:hypothetical protein
VSPMRFRLMGTYRGVPYEAGVGPSDSDVVLFAACPPPEELGFEPAPGHWRKRVIRAEVDVLWESRPVGTFHGEPCLVLDDLGDRLHIVYQGTDTRRARELGYWQVDRGVFELLTPREEVTGLTEVKAEKGLPRRSQPAGPPLPSYPYSAPAWPPAPAAATAGRGSHGRDGYPGEPALAQAGAWNGGQAGGGYNGTGSLPPAAGYNGTGSAPPGYNGTAAPAGTGGWIRNGSGAPIPGANGNGVTHGTGDWNRTGPRPPHGHAAGSGRRAARKQRVQTRSIFSELADLAAIPRSAYALEQESDGAMCLVRTGEGFEVFSAADGARHEVRSFDDEEAAYFYLFGVLAAEAIRNGSLVPPQ